MKIALYFGTFNPIHIGHLIVANHMAEYAQVDQVWMVVTPHNPHKKKDTLLDNNRRLEMVHLATALYEKIKPSNIEFKLPQPNYTVDTLAYLQEKHPQHQFSLVMGEDNLNTLPKWKNYEVILDNYPLLVYPRQHSITSGSLKDHPHVFFVDAPLIEISATFIRQQIKLGKNVRPLLPEAVWQYIDRGNIYR